MSVLACGGGKNDGDLPANLSSSGAVSVASDTTNDTTTTKTETTPQSASNTPPVTISNTTTSSYVWTKLLVGKKVYIDRGYTYSNNLAAYKGLDVLQTANDDKASAGDPFFSFIIDKTATVYIGYARSSSSAPAWLKPWTPTGDTIKTSDRVMYLYKKTFNAGTVELGGNEGAPSMYFVLVDDGVSPVAPIKEPDVVTLTWRSPQKNEDGSNVTDLAGYIVYYGTKSGQYTNTITINNPVATKYQISNLSPNRYYFAISAVDYSGNESVLTLEQAVTIDPV